MTEKSAEAQPLGLGEALSALMPAPSPPPPPSLEQQILMLVGRFGAEAVKAALKAATKKPRGRVPERDWALMRDDFIQDARDWLEGRDPSGRSNYSIAQRISREHPGHSAAATLRRIQRKLAAKRHLYTLYSAMPLAEKEYPFGAYFRTLEALAEAKEDEVWSRILEMHRQTLERYRELHGEPESTMTWAEIEAAPRYPVLSLGKLGSTGIGGMFGAPLSR